jgi:hypothetical protein
MAGSSAIRQSKTILGAILRGSPTNAGTHPIRKRLMFPGFATPGCASNFDCAWLAVKRPGAESEYHDIPQGEVAAILEQFLAIADDPQNFNAFLSRVGFKRKARASLSSDHSRSFKSVIVIRPPALPLLELKNRTVSWCLPGNLGCLFDFLIR